MVDLKSYFHEKYKGGESFIDEVIKPIFGEDKYEDAYEEDILENNPELTTVAQNTGIAQILRLGTINIPMNPTDVFDITVGNHVQMKRNRVAVQQLIRRIMSTYSSAFMVFHYEDDDKWDWRFSFCSKQGSNQESTDSKRYTFLLGPNQSCRTAADNFKKLASKTENIKLEDIIKAFDVEVLSDEFFEKYKEHYEKFCNYIYDNKNDETKFGEYFATCPDKEIRDYVKKLLGRLVFLQFLQKKRWLGGTSCLWNDGDPDFLQNLFKNATAEQKADFLDSVLEPLFQLALDCDRKATSHDFNTGVEGFTNCKIPYLNGGLFSSDKDIDDANSDFPAEYFESLFKFFSEYNFTIDENDPNDAEVGIDPEMLGRIFENLLEDNKDKGAFYTPKYVVQYMCKESLIRYLQTDFSKDTELEAIRSFVQTNKEEALGGKASKLAIKIAKRLRNVKICDPAIGSGAFPMGILRELYACRSVLEDFETISPADIKKEIIQNNIYGVDIEKGAVDIARLRFWLTLILDEEGPEALPNLDFKIMQGNSLLESFQGVDLSHIATGKQKATKAVKVNPNALYRSVIYANEQEAMDEIQHCIRAYYNTDNHSAKKIIFNKIETSVQQYLLSRTGNHPDIQDLILDLPLCNEQYFLWHTFFADVFEKGGFDIVIGNPPYIRQEKLGKEYKELLTSVFPKVGNGTADILVYFFGLGLKVLTPKGIMSFITSNKFLKTKYGKELRNTLATETDVKLFIDFFELPVFHNASTDAGITILVNQNPQSETRYYPIKTLDNLNLTEVTAGPFLKTIKNETEWQFINTSEEDLLNKLYADSLPLGKFVKNKIYSGIKTAFNKAFVLSKENSNMLIGSESRDIVKRYAVSTDIQQWGLKNYDKYFLATGYDIDVETLYPTAFNFLLQFKNDLEKRCDKGAHYYNLRACAYYKDFDKEKIIYIHTSKNHQFYLDTEGRYINNSCYMIVSNNRFLFAFLNSKLFKWFKKKKFVAYGDGDEDGRCKLDYNKMITVPIKADVDETPFKEIVDKVYAEKKQNPNYDTSAAERQLNDLIYQLYDLTDEEIAIVEGTIKE